MSQIPVNHFELLSFCSQKAKEQHNKNIEPNRIYDVMLHIENKIAFRFVESRKVNIPLEDGGYDSEWIEDGDNYLEINIQ